MAENTIDNLSIQVVASAERAISTFNRLASGASGLRGAARGAAGGMQDMAQSAEDMGTATHEAGEQAGKAEKSTRSYGKAAKDAGDGAKKGASGIAEFLGKMKSVATYRFIRSILKGITDGFREGAQNLYQWSKGTGLSDFSKNLDRIATSALYLKNSLGAMLEPIIRVLTPIIETVVDGLVWIINHVNMLFAALSGSQTYTVAKKVATTWGDAAQDVASSTHKAAEDIRRTLLGFDEINRLDKPNSGSGSGGYGGNNNNNNFNDMFETRQLEGWMAALAKGINDFNLQIPATIAAIVAGFETIKLAIKAVSDLSLGWLKDMAGKTIEVAVSLVRSGWETIKGWAVSFGEAVVDLAVRVKTKIADLWASIVTAWNALSPVLQVGIVVSVTAAALWAAYQLAWALAPEKVLEINAKLVTTAEKLRDDLVKAWNGLPVWVLNVGIKIATTANALKDGLVNAWNGLAVWTLGVGVKIVTTANSLKEGLVTAWNNLAAWTLSVGAKIVTTANDLKDGLVKAWNNLAVWSLNVGVKIATTASSLKDGLVKAWNNLATWALGVGVTRVTTAQSILDGLKEAWNKVSQRWLGISVIRSSTAQSILDGLKTAWNSVPQRWLNIGVVRNTTAQSILDGLKTAWNSVPLRWLGIAVIRNTTAQSLLDGLKDAWNKVSQRWLTIGIAVTTSAQSILDGLKEAWNKVSQRWLGIAVIRNSTAQSILDGLKEAWNKVSLRWLTIGIVRATTAQSIKDDLVSAWNKLPAWSLDVAISSAVKIKNAIDNVWTWVKDNWKVVAAAALGIGIAIATPWSTIATALSGLWADVMASFGGALSFGVLPVLGGGDLGTNPSPKKIKEYMDNNIMKPIDENAYKLSVIVNLVRDNWETAKKWIEDNGWNKESVPVFTTLVRYGWTYVDKWIKDSKYAQSPIAQLISLAKNGWDWVDTWAQQFAQSPISQKVDLVLGTDYVTGGGGVGGGTVWRMATQARGGIITAGGVTPFARGGVINAYAGGTSNAHGTIFLAGEAGPEIVGHVGGRTEVLNKSQIASAMFAAVRSAMAPAAANFAAAAQIPSGSATELDCSGMYDIICDAVSQALASDSGRREQTQLLRQISDKDFSAEITTSSMNKAQTRMNRRAGVTLVPVGT